MFTQIIGAIFLVFSAASAAVGAVFSFVSSIIFLLISTACTLALTVGSLGLLATLVAGAAFVHKTLSDPGAFRVSSYSKPRPAQKVVAEAAEAVRTVCGEKDRDMPDILFDTALGR